MEEVRTVTGSLDRDLRREGHAGGVGGLGGGWGWGFVRHCRTV